MGKAVATEGDVTAAVSKTDPKGVTGGKWGAGTIDQTPYKELTVGGKKVIYKAECEFSYTGGTLPNGSTAPTEKETVTLTAKAKLLQSGESYVLVDGDSEASKVYENKLSVSTQNSLSSD